MCKERIEKAARIKGVQKANWNVKTKMLNVSFDSTKTTLYSIQKSIAAVGHDTREVKASDESYNALHGCCQYERKAFKE
jgi:copper chaperone CopZ